MRKKPTEKGDALLYLAHFGIKTEFDWLIIPRGMQVGIKLWSVIDFLCNKHNYKWRKV
jgi:hypothetical protein